MYRALLAVGLSVSVVFGAMMPSQVSADRKVYVVRAGDVLSRIAEEENVSVEELREWNSLESDLIQVGQELVTEPEPAPPEGIAYRIERGDTLSHIAARNDTTVPMLLAMNPGLRPNRIRQGQEIRVPEPPNGFDYALRPGESLGRIALRHEVAVRDLLRWNPRISPDRVRVGTTLRIYSEIPPSRSESIGSANRGRLVHGEQLTHHAGYVIRDEGRAWGTLETIRWIVEGFEAVVARFGSGPRVRVHDLSGEHGGPMRDHRSHQSGRDVDISYFQRHCRGGVCRFARIGPDQLDAPRQWTLLESWLKRDRVEAVFIDYGLQRPLYEQARQAGATRGELERWFQYPRGRGHPGGIIRHYRSHRDHLHARFRCPDTDEECRETRVLAAASR